VTFLGRIVSEKGYCMDNKNIAAVEKLKSFQPKNVGDVRLLMGMLGYHRRHIQDFARIAKPISNLLLGKKDSGTVSSKQTIIWNDACQ